MNDWQPAFLANHDPFFPIFSGEHDGVWSDCTECHSNPATFTDFTCLACHEHRQSKMDEEHQGISGYAYESTACLSCHPDGSKGDFVDHDNLFFPIFSGTHQGSWQECLECHTNPADRKEFTCLECHEHRQTQMDTKHAGIPGYAYQSSDCLTCHPDGQKGEFREHDDLFFPIFSGTHQGSWQECLECHTNPADRKQFTCLDCHEHRQTEMDATHAGIPGYLYASTQCFFCHPNGEKGEFGHEAYFPIAKGPHDLSCIECHVDVTNAKVFECILCHEHNQTKMDEKHKEVQGYFFQSTACYDCHPNGKS